VGGHEGYYVNQKNDFLSAGCIDSFFDIDPDKNIFITPTIKDSCNLIGDDVFENVLELTEQEANESNTLKLKALTHH
jgi:hypothetical protein